MKISPAPGHSSPLQARFSHWLASPVFPNDETKTRRAALLNLALIITFFFIPALVITDLINLGAPGSALGFNITFLVACWVIKLFLNKGYVRGSSLAYLTLAFIMLTVEMVRLDTVVDPTTSFYILIILIACLLFNRKGYAITATLSSLAVLGLIWLESATLPTAPDYGALAATWISFTATFFCAGAITLWSFQAARQALTRADREIAERMNAEEAKQVSEERYKAQFKNLPIPTYTWQRTGNDFVLIDFNDAAMEFTGGAIVNSLGRTRQEAYANQSQVIEDSEYCYTHQATVRREQTFTFTSTGITRDVDMTYVFIPPDLVTVHVEDITERKAVQAALQKGKEILQEAQAIASLGSYTEDIRTGMFDVTPEAARLVGWTAGLHTSDEFLETIHPDDRKLVIAAWEAAKQGAPYDTEHRVVVKDEVLWVHTTAKFTFDQAGTPITAFGVIQNITDRKLAEKALKESEERFRLMFQDHQAAMLLIDPRTGQILDANTSAQTFYGYSWAELTGLNIANINMLKPEEIKQEMQRALLYDRNYFEFPHRLSNGEIRVVEVYSSPLVVNEKPALFSIIHDITTRKQAEQALRESEERFRTVADYTSDWEYWIDENSQLLYLSPSCERITGYKQDEFLHDPMLASKIVHPDDRSRFNDHINEAFSSPDLIGLDFRIITSDGNTRWINHTCRRIYTADQHPHGRRVSNRDISERKWAEEELRTSQAKLQELNRSLEERVQQRTAELQISNQALEKALQAKNEFMAAMSHELRTPLTHILGISEVLQLNPIGNLSEKQLKSVGAIHKSGERLLRLINDIIDFSLLQSGDLYLRIVSASLAYICNASLLAVKSQGEEKQQKIEFSITPETINLQVDEGRIKQILTNLLENAVKFTPAGGRIELKVTGIPAEHQVRISVSDTGIGIKAEDLPKLFQPFVQIDARLSRQYEGTGLGLALVKSLVELHGGSVSVESTFGQGSTFTVFLPWQGE